MALTQIGFHSRQAGVWETINRVHRNNGSWQEDIHTVWARNAGAWKKTYVSAVEEINIVDEGALAEDATAIYDATARYLLHADGSAQKSLLLGGLTSLTNQWKTIDYRRDCEVKYDIFSGPTSTALITTPTLAEGVYADLDQTREFGLRYFSVSTPGLNTIKIDVTIRQKVTGDGETTARITILAIGGL